MEKIYSTIVKHYEKCLEKYGDNHKGVDWPKLADVDKRYKIMLDIIRLNEDDDKVVSLLDFGCGAAHLYEYIKKNEYQDILYSGLDISQKFIDLANAKYPKNFFLLHRHP